MDHYKIVGDGDIWVEKKRRIRHGFERSYFRSVKTERCQWEEPPTGASHVIYMQQLAKCPPGLQTFALEPYNGYVFCCSRSKEQRRRYRRRPVIGFEE